MFDIENGSSGDIRVFNHSILAKLTAVNAALNRISLY